MSYGQESVEKRISRIAAGVTVCEVVCKWKEGAVNPDLVQYYRNLSSSHPEHGKSHDKHPAAVKHFTRCVSLFQRVDGVDVLQFVLYVHEYPRNCSHPNKGRVYISYLDSVKFFEPCKLRTSVFQEILHVYFFFIQKSGFYDTVHLWSCPTKHSDDYIIIII